LKDYEGYRDGKDIAIERVFEGPIFLPKGLSGHPLKGTCQEKKVFLKQERAFL